MHSHTCQHCGHIDIAPFLRCTRCGAFAGAPDHGGVEDDEQETVRLPPQEAAPTVGLNVDETVALRTGQPAEPTVRLASDGDIQIVQLARPTAVLSRRVAAPAVPRQRLAGSDSRLVLPGMAPQLDPASALPALPQLAGRASAAELAAERFGAPVDEEADDQDSHSGWVFLALLAIAALVVGLGYLFATSLSESIQNFFDHVMRAR